jgi:hypothetical protein
MLIGEDEISMNVRNNLSGHILKEYLSQRFIVSLDGFGMEVLPHTAPNNFLPQCTSGL